MKKEKFNCWMKPKEANLRISAAMPYTKQVHVFNDQTSLVLGRRQCYHITVRISLFRFKYKLEDTIKDLENVCKEGMPLNIPYRLYIKTKFLGRWDTWDSDVCVMVDYVGMENKVLKDHDINR